MAVVSGGTTLIDNGALDAGVPTGSLILLSTQTASASASISFTSGIDSTYDSYVFKFINIHPSVDNTRLGFNLSTDGGSNYNVTKTSTSFYAYHNEADNDTALGYNTDGDLAQSTLDQRIYSAGGASFDGSLDKIIFTVGEACRCAIVDCDLEGVRIEPSVGSCGQSSGETTINLGV